MKKKPEIFLQHILESIKEIEKNVFDLDKESFLENTTIQDAVIRRLEIIGEATKNISEDFRGKYPEIEWRKIAGLRDIIVHAYFQISLDLVWKIIQKDIPVLDKQLQKIMKENI